MEQTNAAVDGQMDSVRMHEQVRGIDKETENSRKTRNAEEDADVAMLNQAVSPRYLYLSAAAHRPSLATSDHTVGTRGHGH